MTITTKYDINQKVWFVCGETRKIKCERVKAITAYVTSKSSYDTRTTTKRLVTTGEYKIDSIVIVYELETVSLPEWVLGESKDYILQTLS